MRELQARIIEEMGVRPEIDPAEEVERRIQFLVEYARSSYTAGFVLGISGGVDSTLAGRLAQLTAERLRAEGVQSEFVAVRLPYGIQADAQDAEDAMAFVGADLEVRLNIKDAVDGMENAFEEAVGREITDFNKGNVKARMRMISQYAIAGERNLLVIGTDHGAEGVTGFFTKHGDGAADLLPLFGLNKRQIRQVLQHIGSPEHLWRKVPTADLLDDKPLQTDEQELGVTYEHIDDYLEGRTIPDEEAEKIEAKWRATRHKRTTPVTILEDWWR